MAKTPPPPATSTYTVTYWAIDAEPAAAVQIPPDLDDIAPALQALGGLGPRRFRTIDRVGTRALDGFHARVKGRALGVEQTLSAGSDALELALELELRDDGPSGSFNTKLQLAVDKPIVLGQTAAGSGAGSDTAGVVLYVVRAQRAE